MTARQPRPARHAPVPFVRRTLVLACAGALFGLAGIAQAQDPAPAAAQAQAATKPAGRPAADAVADLDTVVVTGIRASIEHSLKAKRASNDIIEAISAEDIGKLPDASIAESLARVPGLATQRQDGRANMISIRGLSPDFAGTTLNGREQATVGENRGVEYDQYPSELISGVAIYKTPDAGLIGQGLSGTVDLHTIHPLDLPGRALVFNLRGEHPTNGNLTKDTHVGTFGHRASFSWIDQFLDHTLGVAIGFAQLDSPIQEKQYQHWWWSVNNGPSGIDTVWGGPHTQGMPDEVASQEGMQLRAQSQRQQRNGLMAVLEWAPGEHYHSTLDMYYSTFTNKTFTNGAQWSNSPYDGVNYADVGTVAAMPYPIVTSGTMLGVKPAQQNQLTHERDRLASIGWNHEIDFDNGWTASADLSWSSARKRLRDAYLFTGFAHGATTDVAFDNPAGIGYPDFRTALGLDDPATMVFTDPYGYGYNGRREADRQKDTIKAVRIEATHPAGWIFSDFTLGLDYSRRVKTKQADVEFAWLNGNGSERDTYDPGFATPIDPNFLRGTTSLGYGGLGDILYYDVLAALDSQFYLTRRNGQGDWSRNYSVTEKVPVAYVKFDIDTRLGNLPLRGNVGVQAVRTDQSSTALQTNGDALVGTLVDGTRYTKLLPSLNLVAQLTDHQYLRFGLAKSMARGRIDDEKVSSSAHVALIQQGPAAGQVLWSGSGGNPHLKPYVAVGTDLSWEMYFGRSSYVSAALFNKNLLNYVYTRTELDHDFSGYVNNDPVLVPSSNIGAFSMPMNGTGGRMRGLELATALEGGLLADALDGFGLQANYSLTDSRIPTSSIAAIPGGPKTLPGLSRQVANLALYYENHGFSARIAERYRSAFTGEAITLFDQLGYTRILANKQTDLQLGYAFDAGRLAGLSLLLQMSNLTNTPDASVQVAGMPNGVELSRPLEYDTWGRTVMFGVNWKL